MVCGTQAHTAEKSAAFLLLVQNSYI